MPRPKSIVPGYRHHVGTGQAIVTITTPSGSRRDVYLGQFATDASVIEYGRVLIQWKTGKVASATPGRLSINELLLQFWNHAKDLYVGTGAKELFAYQYALKPLKHLFGATPADQFGPKRLKEVREAYIGNGWCRKQINRQVNRIRRLFKWAVSEELISATVLESLRSVPGLQYGRSRAPESKPVKPVDVADVEAVLPYLTPTVRAMVLFQRHTGCRPGEVVQLRLIDLDRSDPIVWWYRPQRHKTQWAGIEKHIAVGPKAQAAITSMMTTDQAIDAPLFSPRRAYVEKMAEKRAKRKTKVQPSQLDRRKPNPKKIPGDQYDVDSYRRAIYYGIRAFSVSML